MMFAALVAQDRQYDRDHTRFVQTTVLPRQSVWQWLKHCFGRQPSRG